jgi:hypothetical protein
VERVVELLRLLLAQRVRPAVLELAERERDRAAARERVDQERAHPLSTEAGRGRTPRKTPGSIATVAADSPRPASICASKPPVECPITAGFVSRASMISVVCSAACSKVFLARTSGFARASLTVSGSSGQSGVSGA